ncbi:MAG: precorrin-8X methylmutase [Pseudomonadota bacterium]
MTPLFDTYLMVDWSAASRPSPPKPSSDAIWWCVARRKGSRLTVEDPVYERARADAMESLRLLLLAERAAGRRVLAGFDFPFGYPRGFAEQLTGEPHALAVWDWLAREVIDGPDNSNNRFDVAEKINDHFDGTGPFWGRPAHWDHPGVPQRGSEREGKDHPPERRLVEQTQTRAQPVWKLFTTGSVGSQVLLGLLALNRLRRDPELEDHIQVWPLETGLDEPDSPIVLAEIYPSMIEPDPGEAIKDAGQVRAVVSAYGQLDAVGCLSPLFAGPRDMDAEDREIVSREEAWILGTGFESVLAEAHAAARDAADAADQGDAPPAPPPQPAPRIAVRTLQYLRDPELIYHNSFQTVRAETRLDHLPEALHDTAVRLVHACGSPEITNRLAWSPDIVTAARAALVRGAPVLCDCEAVAHSIVRPRLPAQNNVICTLRDACVPDLAEDLGNTRSAAAVELWEDQIEGAVVAIGNAPTALFHLLELLDDGWPKPAAILGFPVGFVGAAESKAELAEHPRDVPFLVLRGRRGGSAMAAAAVNALAAGLETPA